DVGAAAVEHGERRRGALGDAVLGADQRAGDLVQLVGRLTVDADRGAVLAELTLLLFLDARDEVPAQRLAEVALTARRIAARWQRRRALGFGQRGAGAVLG